MTKHKIALIDDDVDTLDLLVGFLKPKGFETHTFQSAEEALTNIKKDASAFDLIITDLQMPGLSGIELSQTLKELMIEIPVIVVTADKSIETAIEAVKAGAFDFVVKPIHFSQLHVSVERALYLNQIQKENQTLRTVVATKEGKDATGIIGKSPQLQKVLELVRKVASTQTNIFISGESGTGKELIAKAVHQQGTRKGGPFVAINCSAIPENLLESELFGHSKGAFTGAVDKKAGLFEEATGGTLFLDEIGDLSLPLQAKLLRVLQEKRIKRIGENQFRNIDVRIVSATHKDLRREIQEGTFREDLFFRLNVIPIHIPPLRDRKEDILLLADHFLKKFSVINKVDKRGFTKEAAEFLMRNPWPGNIRELENTIERAVVIGETGMVELVDLEFNLGAAFDSVPNKEGANDESLESSSEIRPLNDVINKYILRALAINDGAKDKTAKDLGIDRKTLYRRLRDSEVHF